MTTLQPQQAIDQFSRSFQRPGAWILFQALKPWLIDLSHQTGQLIPPLAELQQLPDGSLGKVFAEFIQTHHLQAISFGSRRVQTHDVVHVLLGAGTDFLGEQDVQWFLLGCKLTWFNGAIGVQLLCQTWDWQRAIVAFQSGRHSTYDPDTVPIEQLWSLPLATVRQRYRIEPCLTRLDTTTP